MKSGTGHQELQEKQILREQVKQLYQLAPIGFVASVVNSVLVFAVLNAASPSRPLLIWLILLLAVMAVRTVHVVWFYSSNGNGRDPAFWASSFTAGALAVGVAWGSLALVIFSFSLPQQVFIAFVLGGMAAGASSTLSMVRWGYPAFSVPALLPLSVCFLMHPDPFYRAMSAMTFLFLILLWRIGHHNYLVSRASLQLRFENDEIIRSLKLANQEVAGLNAQLKEEIAAKLEAEAELRGHRDQLERTVQERTADLMRANEHLRKEIEERESFEKALKETQHRLIAAKEAAEAATAAKSQFLANMTHEMRTPLAGTLGMIKLVLDMKIGAEERELLEMAQRSSESLLRLIADLLDFSRVEAGMLKIQRKVFSVVETVRSSVEVVSTSAAQKGLGLSWEVDDAVQEVEGDQGRVRQVLVNLLGNAVKFTQQGSIEVKAAPHVDDAGRRCILFSVRDTGIGIPAGHLEHIFEKFTQLDGSLTRQHGGTGLGLALSREIVENLGGRIWAESSDGKGSVFHFTLPVAPPAEG